MWEEGKASSKSPSQARSPWPVRSELGFSCPRVFFERKDKVYLEPRSPWSPPKPLSFKKCHLFIPSGKLGSVFFWDLDAVLGTGTGMGPGSLLPPNTSHGEGHPCKSLTVVCNLCFCS